MKISQIITFFIVISIIGCNETAENKTISTTEKQHISKEKLSGWELDIALNDGAKWHANPATNESIEKMSELVGNTAPATPEAFRNLGKQLNQEKELLLKKCTMKGSAHNNLHIYLQPLMGRIGELQEVESVERGRLLTGEIEQHLEAYYNYFS